ncbi:MAG: hypothetical protein K1X36_10885 [Pyrinomonadaceae bacterium]|nr:hypothetical protein [Pyrinomonadaceae bacterium]
MDPAASDVRKKHSKLGIASTIVAVGVWVYFAVMFVLVFYVDGFSGYLTDLFVPESRGMTDLRGMGVGVVLFSTIFLLLPVVGHLIGTILGTAGLFVTSRKRLFSVIGIVLNLLPAAVLFFLFLVGGLTPSA